MYRYFFLFCFFFSLQMDAQEIPITRMIVAKTKEHIIKAYVLHRDPQILPQKEMTYYTYHHNRLHENQGGYSGHLLDGNYEVYSKNNQLLEQGTFHRGLKDCIWKQWSTDGNLLSFENWKDGRKHGAFEKYDSQGHLIQKGNYKKGEVHGEQTRYDNGAIIDVQKYKKGQIVVKKNKTKKTSSTNSKKEESPAPTKGG